MSDSVIPLRLGSIAGLLLRALGAAGITFGVPWLIYAQDANDSGWPTSVTLGAWILVAMFGASGLMAGDRARNLGAATMIGGVLGAAAFIALT
jgi:hypothetical protein